MRFKDLLKEQRIIVEGRKEDAREKYPDIPQSIFDLFVDDDPSGNHKYLMWMCKVWDDRYGTATYTARAVNLVGYVIYFHNNPHKYEKKDINQYKSITELKRATEDAKVKLTKGELKRQSRKLYETDRYLIVEPTSHASSCYYGSGTRWCTTMKDYPNYFNGYYKKNSLFYFINKRTGKKRAFLTALGSPMFGGSIDEPNYEQHVGTIFTETDNVGRSMRGIPVEGRMAMAKRHAEKSLEKDNSINTKLRFGHKVLTRIIRGDLKITRGISKIPNSIRKVEGDLVISGTKIPGLNNITEVGGSLLINYWNSGVGNSLGKLKIVGADLKLVPDVTDLGDLESVGGSFTCYAGSCDRLTSLKNLKHVGTLYLDHFPSLTLDELKKVDRIDNLYVSHSRYSQLFDETLIKLPNLPNTPIEVV